MSVLSEKDYKKLCKQLDLFGFKSYKEFQTSPLWVEFRRVVYRKRPPASCKICHKEAERYNLHHTTYKRLLDPNCVIWVCDECHERIHEEKYAPIETQTQKLIAEFGSNKKKRLGSLAIIPSSGLPETFHLSLNATGLVRMVREGEQPSVCLKRYYDRKLQKNDILMVELLKEYFDEALAYLEEMATE